MTLSIPLSLFFVNLWCTIVCLFIKNQTISLKVCEEKPVWNCENCSISLFCFVTKRKQESWQTLENTRLWLQRIAVSAQKSAKIKIRCTSQNKKTNAHRNAIIWYQSRSMSHSLTFQTFKKHFKTLLYTSKQPQKARDTITWFPRFHTQGYTTKRTYSHRTLHTIWSK